MIRLALMSMTAESDAWYFKGASSVSFDRRSEKVSVLIERGTVSVGETTERAG